MAEPYDITPKQVPLVETPYRRIRSAIPHPDSVPTLEALYRYEPISMRGQPPIVWERAEGVQVWDRYGNMWLDWSSGVLVTNAGHGIAPIREAILDHVPFPDGYRTEDTSFHLFLRTLDQKGVTPDRVAGVISETYQGAGPDFMPRDYAQRLGEWCRKNEALLIFDEVQAAFGRTGTLWGFEHYGVVPDVICCGKGISSSLPLGAVIGRTEIMDQFPAGSMTSTHTGNPLCARAALASLKAIVEGGLI